MLKLDVAATYSNASSSHTGMYIKLKASVNRGHTEHIKITIYL
jgi:hypothetical protein